MEAAQEILQQMTPPPPPEAPAEGQAAPAPVQQQERVSGKIESLIRREQQALQKERQAKEQMAQAQAMLQKIQDFEQAKTNPKKALDLLGLNYDELTKSLLADGTIPPEVEIKKLKDEFGAYKTEQQQAEQRRAQEEQQRALAQQTQAVDNFKTEINNYINENASRYELITFEDKQQEVYDLIDAHFDRTRDPKTGEGKIMTIAEAADKVEAYYEKREQEKKKLAKLQTIWGAVPQKTMAQAMKQVSPQVPQKPTTLTNTLSATPTKPAPRLSEE